MVSLYILLLTVWEELSVTTWNHIYRIGSTASLQQNLLIFQSFFIQNTREKTFQKVYYSALKEIAQITSLTLTFLGIFQKSRSNGNAYPPGPSCSKAD